jgi:hypothetical protein
MAAYRIRKSEFHARCWFVLQDDVVIFDAKSRREALSFLAKWEYAMERMASAWVALVISAKGAEKHD